MAIKSIVGQDNALRILYGTLKKERVPSAILMSGDSGIGKMLAAINYAKAINCLNPVNFDCCDNCMSCKKIDASIHPDILNITLDNVEDKLSLEERRAKDSNRYEYPIEAVRKIEEFLYLRPNEARKKIVIIDDAETMNINAANSFLKTLEEPPADSLIILVSSNPDRLPDTIRSRCVTVRFKPLGVDVCRKVISENIDTGDAELAIRFSMGRPGIAIAKDMVKETQWFISLLDDMKKGVTKESWTDKGEIKAWLDMAHVFLRDMVIFKITGNTGELIMRDMQETEGKKNRRQFSESGIRDLLQAYQSLEMLRGLLDSNLNKAITWNYVASIMKPIVNGHESRV